MNVAGQYTADIEQYIADEVLPLSQRQLVAYQFGDPLELPKGRGTTYTATRFNRLPLPAFPLTEGAPPAGETLSLSQVTAVAQQWGDRVGFSDVAELTIKHPLMKEANRVIGLQIAETLERNTFNSLMALTQVNFVNSRTSRALLQAGDVLDPHTVNRTVVALHDIGAPEFMGEQETDHKFNADTGSRERRASESPRTMPHYVAICSPNVLGDFSENNQVVQAWTFSDINRLYNSEVGEWRGMRFCRSNMVPSFTGFTTAAVATPGVAGSLATNAGYRLIVTGSDIQNQYESQIFGVTAAINVTGPNGSISFTTPNTAGFTWNAYLGTTATPTNLATSPQGPTTGPLAGMAVQLPSNTVVTLTGIGVAQTPPAAPANGVTVFPTFVIGRGAYGQVKLDDVKTSWLDRADKSDVLNQQRWIGWKVYYGSLILNTQFAARIESSSAFSATFT